MHYPVGVKVVSTKAPYRGQVGIITEVYPSEEGYHYGVALETPAKIIIHGIEFEDHRHFLADHDDLQLLTTMGETIYGSLESDREKTL